MVNLHFKKITYPDMETVWKYLSKEKGKTCDFSYGGIFMWVDYFQYEYAIFEETLFIKGLMDNDDSTITYSLPIGKLPIAESVKSLMNYCRQQNQTFILSAVPEYAITEISKLGPHKIIELPNWGDYLYDAETLAHLSGRKMAKKRNHINQFNRLYPNAIYEQITSKNINELKLFMYEFSFEPLPNKKAQIERELSANIINYISRNDNPMMGGLLKIDNKVVAFTIGDIKGDTLYIHIEKANRLIQGSYEMINSSFVTDVINNNPQIKYINREDDSGEEGLRKAKLSYYPIEILKKYAIIF